MAKQKTTPSPISSMVSDFDYLQLKECIETFRSQFNLIIQIFTVFIVANVTILGYAMSNQISGIVLVGAVIPVLMSYIASGASKFMMPVLYTAVSLEKKYGEPKIDYLATTFLSTLISTDFINRLQEISQIEDHSERIRTLGKERLTLIYRKKFRALLIFISTVQIATAVLLNLVFGWPLF